ncbi:tetratricopeptide repeat protein [Shewanella sp. OMA3-2]|uniref:tetratricopeptide repeat protein n=1 Tax=Shewanella sp. OMA3-2 TaxID=2908650 RepID=UPI001F2B7016|nr:tetratricopeptide repeat protein [Shewanella sp. OMA3-2]UJF23216.1 tetratricopeptide repeat protein [Shewanella sp. OMA3-2]
MQGVATRIKRATITALIGGCLVLANTSVAEPYTPKSDDEVVAKWKVLDDSPNIKSDQISLTQISDFIEQGQYPGEADYRYGRAKAWLQAKMNNTSPDAQTLYLYARVLQHQHQFDKAIKVLQRAISLDPSAINSWLLKANIHLVQGDIISAREACLALIGKASILLISACALEVSAQNGKLAESYQELARLYTVYSPTNEQEKQWISQILADMALRQAQADNALVHLQQIELNVAPVSLLALWADVQMSLNQYEQVIDKIGDIVNRHPVKDDALLLRLAKAEKQLNTNLEWQTLFAQRVELREQRQDSLHASELAQYYLYVDVQPIKALYWAKINWRVAKQINDRLLLENARSLLKSSQQDKETA